VSIKGIEGPVLFKLDRYKSGGDYFSKSGQFEKGLESAEVRSWIELEIQNKSYEQVSQTLKKVTGTRLYSSNHISEKVKAYAEESTINMIKSYGGLQLSLPFGATDIDLYDSKSDEILLFDDAIGVNRQKEERKKGYVKKLKRVQTDVIEVQKVNGDFEYITAGYGVIGWTIETALCCWMCVTYGNKRLPLVAITDGAKDIRLRLWRVFGGQVTIILDWYHLNKKVVAVIFSVRSHKSTYF
jgi:hypothetical protein